MLCIITKYSIPHSKVSITKLFASFKVFFILYFFIGITICLPFITVFRNNKNNNKLFRI